MKDLLKRKVSVEDPYILLFFYPTYQIITDLKQPIEYSKGVIYKGLITESIISKLNTLTSGNYILLSDIGEINLHKPSDFISIFLPAIQDKAEQYNNYSLEQFIPIFKQYYILQKKPPVLKEEENTIFTLFKAILGSKQELVKTYISLLETLSPNIIASSLLTFLLKVKEQNYTQCSPSYKKLINTAYLKFGNKIKPAVKQYIESKQNPELALWLLLDNLNG